MSDGLWGDRRFCTFNVVDDFNREGVAIEVDFNLPATHQISSGLSEKLITAIFENPL